MNNLAKEINSLLLDNSTIKEYLEIKNVIENDTELKEIIVKLDKLRKEICKDKNKDSDEYFALLDRYNNDSRVKKYNQLKKEISEYFVEISDILSLK